MRYALKNVLRLFRNPHYLLLAFAIFNGWLYSHLFRPTGVDVLERKWDNLLILDGCRYDMFEEISNIDGELEKVLSQGSHSWPFLENNFKGRELHDTIYVTANPYAYQLPHGLFFHILNLLDDSWNNDLGTVPPGSVVKASLKIHDQYPNKRLIIHFMQPHYPFIGPLGKELESSGRILKPGTKNPDDPNSNPWTKLMNPFVREAEPIVRAYRENLEVVLPHVHQLIEDLDGHTVVTSDHGNLIGERTYPIPMKTYGHHRGLMHEKLLEVPWLVVNDSERRHVEKDSPIRTERISDYPVEDRLRRLGYHP